MKEQLTSLLPKTEFTRREFVATTVAAAGFALAAQPISAQTVIQTDSNGLEAGMTTIPTTDGRIPAYYARPAGNDRYPLVLVVQEIFGVHEHIQDVCRRFAKLGHMAVAPDLYVRQGDVSSLSSIQEILQQVVYKVPDEQVMNDLDATAAWAGNNHGDTTRMGVTGFCWGGRITWLYCAHNPILQAGVAWYGHLEGNPDPLHPKYPIDLVNDLKAPVLGLYGGKDRGISLESVEKMRRALSNANSPSDIRVYDDAQHGFHADYRPSYDPAAAQDGFQRLQSWFQRHGAA
jgi:carboxymethylenebutenolidase